MSKNIVLFITLFYSIEGFSQWLKVTDATTGNGLSAAVIKIAGSNWLVSDNGILRLDNVPAATKLSVSAIGFQTLDTIYSYQNDTFFLGLLPMPNHLEEVVVSGNLRPMTRLQSPISVEVYNQSFFTRNVTPNIFEALTVANGIQPQLNCNVCNTGDIHINGLEGPYTMVLIDGMPLVSSLGTVYGLMGIPNTMIKRMEVVKGPASTLYGSEAVGGLINIITKEPTESNAYSLDISHSTYNEVNLDLGANFQLRKANTLLGVNGFYYNTPHDKNNDGFTDITQQQRISLFNKWSFERQHGLQAGFSIRLFAEDRWGGQTNWTKQLAGSNTVYGETIQTKRAEWLGRYDVSKNLLLETSYAYHNQQSWYGTTPYNALQHTAFAQLRWQKSLGSHFVTAGLPMRYLNYDDNSVATQKADGANAPDKQLIAGMFLQDEWKASPALTILGGLRAEHHSVQGMILSPRLAFKYAVNSAHTLRLSAGNGFRVVNLFTEDHAALTGARQVVIEESLRPERSWNVNLNYGAVWYPGNGVLHTDVSLFYTRFSNKIIPDYDTDPDKIIYRNLRGHGISQGLTVNVDWLSLSGVKASAGITVMDVRNFEPDENGVLVWERQLQAPVFSGTFSAGYKLKRWKTSIDFTGKINGPMRLPVLPNDFRPEYSPAYALANVQLTQPIGQRFALYVAVKNLLNFFPDNPLIHADDPFDRLGGKYWLADGTANPVTNPNAYTFDPSYNYAPLQKRRLVWGIRLSF